MAQLAQNMDNNYEQVQIFSKSFLWLQKRCEISHLAKALYAVVGRYSMKSGVAFVSLERLAEELGASVRSLSNAMKELRDHNLIVVVKRGLNQPNHYILPKHIWMAEGKTYTKQPKVVECVSNSAENKAWQKPTYPYNKINNNYIYNNNNIPIPRTREAVPRKDIPMDDNFEKFYSSHPRPVNRVDTYHEYLKAIKDIPPQKLIDKAKAYGSSITTESEKKYCLGTVKWLQDKGYKRCYGRHEVDFHANYAECFNNSKPPFEDFVRNPGETEEMVANLGLLFEALKNDDWDKVDEGKERDAA